MIEVTLPTESLATRRDDPAHYTIADLPTEFVAFETPVEGLGVGQAGKVGLLELDFANSGGATRVVRQFQKFPLQVFRPIYLDPQRPEMAFVYVMSHGGIVQGDRYRLDLNCGPGASVHLTTQSATKIYRMESNYATQLVRLSAGPQSFLEYLPEPVIPFRDARFHGRIELHVHPTATLILGEILLPGRVAHGERHDYTIYASDLVARSSSGPLLFSDRLKFSSTCESLHSPGRFGTHEVLASLFVISGQGRALALSDRLHKCVSAHPGVVGGASELPNGCGVWVRLLGSHSFEVSSALHSAWNEARLALIGVPAPDRRKT